MNLSIIIPTMNTTGDCSQDRKVDYSLTQCLRSLEETVPDIPIVIASNNGDPKWITMSKNMSRINLWEQGQCKAVNAAVQTTNTEWIMITNDDMIYSPMWLKNLEFTYDCFSPKLVEPQDGAPTFIKHFCGGAGGDFNKDKFYEYLSTYNGNGFKTGFNLPFIIRRELWDLVGGYDISYDPWGSNSDSDLEYKIKLAGVQPMQSQASLVYHFSQTSGTFNPTHHDAWVKNSQYFEQKWGFPRTDEGIWEADFKIDYQKLKYRPKWAVIS